VIGGAALLLLAACAPWALFRLLPFLESGAVGHLEGLGSRARQTATGPAKQLAHAAIGAPLTAALAARAGGGLVVAGSRAVGSAAGGGGGGAARAGAGGGSGGGSPGPTGGGPLESGPEAEPSTAESTGVGSMSSPGHNIPLWADDPDVSALGNRLTDDLAAEAATGGDPGSSDGRGPAPTHGL
jgi:hypothetical protein